MRFFQNRVVITLASMLALLVFAGDVLDDVWVPATANAVTHSSPSDQQKGNAPKTSTASHDDTVALNTPSQLLNPADATEFAYFEVVESAPACEPPAIDHPPQLG